MRVLLLRSLLVLTLSRAPCLPSVLPPLPCPSGCCCPRPGVLVLCESLGLRVIPRAVPLTTSALSVARNHLCNVDNLLRRHSSLRELSLGHNRLERFPRGLPSSLESLQLQDNRIAYVTAGDVRNLGNLTRLDLEGNRIRAIQPGALGGLACLKVLSLKGNRLATLPPMLPPSLAHLDLSGNCISALEGPSLGTLVDLQVLKINRNLLRSVPEGSLDDLPRLRSLDLSDNLWACECNLMYLYLWLLRHRMPAAGDLTCATPLDLAGRLLVTLSVMAVCPRVLRAPDGTAGYRPARGRPSRGPPEAPTPHCGRNSSSPRSRPRSTRSPARGLSHERCLLLNSTYLVPRSTQPPYEGGGPGCYGNATELPSAPPSTPATFYPTGDDGIRSGAPPRTPTRSGDPGLVVLLSVLCVLSLLLLLTTMLVLRVLLRRSQRVAPIQSSASTQRNTGA